MLASVVASKCVTRTTRPFVQKRHFLQPREESKVNWQHVFWKHDPTNFPQYTPPEADIKIAENSKLNKDQVREMQRLRHEDPLYWTPRRLEKKYRVSQHLIRRAAPAPNYLAKAREQFIEARRLVKPVEDKTHKRQRLVNWWFKQYEAIEEHRDRRKLYKKYSNAALQDPDIEFIAETDLRDFRAEEGAEKVKRAKKLAGRKKKK